MKIAKLLVLSALWLVAGSAMALDDVRQKPANIRNLRISPETIEYIIEQSNL